LLSTNVSGAALASYGLFVHFSLDRRAFIDLNASCPNGIFAPRSSPSTLDPYGIVNHEDTKTT
jgi:hypothetical protein